MKIIPNGKCDTVMTVGWLKEGEPPTLLYYPLVETTIGMQRINKSFTDRIEALTQAQIIMSNATK